MVPKKSSRERQPRRFDTTQCRAATYGRLVHRDYLAHCFRWGWAAKFIKKGQSVLDVGCGQDAPLAHVLTGAQFVHGGRYVGVDMNRTIKGPGRQWCDIRPEFNFVERWGELGEFDVVVNFEVIEHMGAEDGAALLAAMRACMKADGALILSTPVFNGRAAKNHVKEYTVAELRGAFEAAGLVVEARYGTFASYPDMKRAATPEDRAVLDAIRVFYSDEVAACFLAPLYPDASRNNLWLCRKVR